MRPWLWLLVAALVEYFFGWPWACLVLTAAVVWLAILLRIMSEFVKRLGIELTKLRRQS